VPLTINSWAASKLKIHLVYNKPVANPDLQLRENDFLLLTLPTFLPSVISFFTRNKEERISSHTIYPYYKKFDWLFIVDPIWLVWYTNISYSLTHWFTHWPVHSICDAPTKRYVFYKNITPKNKSIKLPFETKDSKHLVGTSGDDSSTLI